MRLMCWRVILIYLFFKEIISFNLLTPTERYSQRIALLSSSAASRRSTTDDEDSVVHQPSPDIEASRRSFLATSASSSLIFLPSNRVDAVEAPQSVRPTVYRVDSTIPPTLTAVPSARAQSKLLTELGRGSGTRKAVTESLNLNNILNRAVFGTIDAFQDLISPKSNTAEASFVCLGITSVSEATMQLATFVAENISRQAQRSNPDAAAIGVVILPLDCQDVLDQFINEPSFGIDELLARVSDQVASEVLEQYKPLLVMAKGLSIRLLAMGLPVADTNTVLKGGLQSLEGEKRSQYVVDPSGFIAQTNDPKFKLYTERVLLRSVDPNINAGNYFAERILAHETAAAIAVRYLAKRQQQGLVTIVAPIEDVRYLGGINGRLPRIYNSVTSVDDNITDDDVTTILLNPTAVSTLSLTRRLRLEIGTGPDTSQYQTKVADYLWFSSSPPVNLLHRVMDY